MSTKEPLAVDLDDVVADTVQGTLAYISNRLGKEFSYGDITTVEYWAKYGISDTEAIALVYEYNEAGLPDLKPKEGAREVLEEVKSAYYNQEPYIVTAREEAQAAVTYRWIDRYYPGIFKDIVFGGNPYINPQARPKVALAQEIGASNIIDDGLTNILPCAEVGMGAILFGKRLSHLLSEEGKARKAVATKEAGPISSRADHLVAYAENWPAVKEYFNAKNRR